MNVRKEMGSAKILCMDRESPVFNFADVPANSGAPPWCRSQTRLIKNQKKKNRKEKTNPLFSPLRSSPAAIADPNPNPNPLNYVTLACFHPSSLAGNVLLV